MKSNACTAVGAGYLTLDLIMQAESDRPEGFAAGGSFGNVMSILSWLGWNTRPFARLGMDMAGDTILADLGKCGVGLQGITQNERLSTPTIVHRYGINSSGTPKHRFEWVCPSCSRWLPRYSPMPKRELPDTGFLGESELCYIDRATPGTLALAVMAKAGGAIVVFEPPRVTDDPVCRACLEICDVLKYSAEYGGRIGETTSNLSPPLEIASLGDNGLKYRLNGFRGINSDWSEQAPLQSLNPVDFAGSGDWLTAGFCYTLFKQGASCAEDVGAALMFGQSLAAINACYAGARGMLRALTRENALAAAASLMQGFEPFEASKPVEWHRPQPTVALCQACLR